MFSQYFSGEALLHWVPIIGYPGLALIILLETGLVIGFMLPGDSLLFTVGILASRGILHFGWIVGLLIVMSILGYTLGYEFGRYLGKWLLKQEDSWYFKRERLRRAEEFYDEYGARSLLLGRFIPVIRTFIPVASGMVHMSYIKYTWCNILGAVIWICSVCGLGYVLGARVSSIDHYLLPIIAMIILVSVLPVLIRWFRGARRQKN